MAVLNIENEGIFCTKIIDLLYYIIVKFVKDDRSNSGFLIEVIMISLFLVE